MVALPTNHGVNNDLLGDVLEAIKVLSPKEQKSILDEIQQAGEISQEFGNRIADLIDSQVGSLQELEEEDQILGTMSGSLDRQHALAAASLKKEVDADKGGAEEAELAEQLSTYNQWLLDVTGIEKQGMKDVEKQRRGAEKQQQADIYKTLGIKPQNHQQN